MNIDKQINREIGIHGRQWNAMHEGYFSDPVIARPLIAKIVRHLSGSDTDIIVDLGGGTGFILSELITKGLTANMIPINLDCSATQLEAIEKQGITRLQSLITGFSRNDLTAGEKRICFIMRSVLHYFGRDGLLPVLRHIRNQSVTGEILIHQTACFEEAKDAQCLNALYEEMATPKWYPTISELCDNMATANWRIIEISPAPPLKLTSAELGQRYGLDLPDLKNICSRLVDEFGEIKDIFQRTPDGFTAYLHYRIFVARAADGKAIESADNH